MGGILSNHDICPNLSILHAMLQLKDFCIVRLVAQHVTSREECDRTLQSGWNRVFLFATIWLIPKLTLHLAANTVVHPFTREWGRLPLKLA
jgi:hypothetical protein